MDKQNTSQLELFSQNGNSGEIKTQQHNNAFLAFIWNYEKTLLIIIGFLITGVISFSLGVEKGKRLVNLQSNVRFDIAKPRIKQIVPENKAFVSPVQQQITIKKEEIQPQPAEKQGYTIQLASYKTKSYAQREAEALKKKGLSPLVLSKGSYIVLCVGKFSNKEAAQSLLSELKKRYQDCSIRRL